VTGAGGFIGSHLTERLVEIGAKVLAFVHYRSDGSRGWLDDSHCRNEIEFVAGDVRDPDSVRRATRDRDIIFHLAALIGIPYSYQAPRSYVATNINGTLNVLQAARDFQIERVVHTSTSEVYGTAQYVPIDEEHPLQGQSPYSASKVGADKMAEAFHQSFELPVVTVRPFNTFGPRQSARAVIPTIISQSLMREVVRIGSEHPTRDFNFVGNTVDGFLSAAVSDKAVGRTVNLGSGKEISIGELARRIVGLVGNDIRVEHEAARTRPEGSEVDRLLAGVKLAEEVLDWTPEISFEEGLQSTIDWVSENMDRYRPDEYQV
jgi:dTDP-glucose 4,6-dehydratase